jgi:hypothetical protein
MLARLRDLEQRFTDVFWREIAPTLALSRSTFQDWSTERIEEDLAELAQKIGAVEGVLARWAGVERKWSRPAARAPQGEGSRSPALDDVTFEAATTRAALENSVKKLKPDFPIDVRVQPNGAGVKWALATSAPRGAGSVTIEPERLLDDLRKMAGVLHDIEVGDSRFDGVFLVRGHEATARSLLDHATRRLLLALGARSAQLHVELADGCAAVQLYGGSDRGLVEEVISVLRRLRGAPVRALRRGE